VLNVAANCTNTIVVIHSAGIRLVDQWIDHQNITAVIFAHLLGQDSGRSVVQLLYGVQSPSGKLPYTVAKNESDYGALATPALPKGEYQLFPQHSFTEGVYIDYWDFDRKNITPRYELGYGLT
jgi:beta-glucosidase